MTNQFNYIRGQIAGTKQDIDELMTFANPPNDLEVVLDGFLKVLNIDQPKHLNATKTVQLNKMEILSMMQEYSLVHFDSKENF